MESRISINHNGEEVPVKFFYAAEKSQAGTFTNPEIHIEIADIIWEDVPEAIDAMIERDIKSIHRRFCIDALMQKDMAKYERETENL